MNRFLYIFFFLWLTAPVTADSSLIMDLHKISIPAKIERLKFLYLKLQNEEVTHIELEQMVQVLEQLPFFPQKHHAMIEGIRAFAKNSLENGLEIRNRLLDALGKDQNSPSKNDLPRLVKFTDAGPIESFLRDNPGARRLHSTLLWVVVPPGSIGLKFQNYEDSLVRVEEDVSLSLEPVIPDEVKNNPPKLWGIERIGTKTAWAKGLRGEGVIVAVVDTGVYHHHSAIADRMWVNSMEAEGQPGVDDDGNGFIDDIHGYNFFAMDADTLDYNAHGSHIAGTIAGWDPEFDFYGVAPQARIMAVKTHNRKGFSSRRAVVEGILYAADNGARVINCSWSGAPEAARWSQLLFDAIEYARQKGALVVAAAGNKGNYNDGNPVYPACYKRVIAVAATAFKTDNVAVFSNYGVKTVHVAAPGVKIYSMINKERRFWPLSGTSMAAPHVSGAAALVIQHLEESLGRKANPDEVKQILMDHAIGVPGTDNKVATGIITLENLHQ